jgi:hypothetical protein
MDFLVFLFFCVIAIAVLPLFYLVHLKLGKLCERHARRYCKKLGYRVQRSRWQPTFYKTRTKTEFTSVQLDCLNAEHERRLVLLRTHPFGVRELFKDEKYPDSYDAQWPILINQP